MLWRIPKKQTFGLEASMPCSRWVTIKNTCFDHFCWRLTGFFNASFNLNQSIASLFLFVSSVVGEFRFPLSEIFRFKKQFIWESAVMEWRHLRPIWGFSTRDIYRKARKNCRHCESHSRHTTTLGQPFKNQWESKRINWFDVYDELGLMYADLNFISLLNSSCDFIGG